MRVVRTAVLLAGLVVLSACAADLPTGAASGGPRLDEGPLGSGSGSRTCPNGAVTC